MKKFITLVMLCGMIAAPFNAVQAEQTNTATSTILSALLPGTGEWHNNNWQGAFPWGECILGSLCVLVRWSSVIDAASGATNDAIRLDFWSAPSN